MVDIITFDYNERLFKIKHNLLAEASKRGIFFELNYSDAIENPDNRRMVISNLLGLIRLSRGTGLILNSGASRSIFHRSPSDLMCL